MTYLRLRPAEVLADGPALSVRDLVELYLRHAAAIGLHCSEARVERERVLRAFAEHCDGMPVDRLKPYHLSEWIEGNARWKSVSTRRAKANAVNACFNWALQQERIERNPFARVRYAEAERRQEMPDETLDRIATLASKPFEYVVRFLRLTGCRLSELCGATWCDVDLDNGVWTIPRHKSRRYTHKPKTVALIAEAVTLLLAIQSLPTMFPAGQGDLIFTNNRGTGWNRRTLGQTLNRLKRKHGINCNASLHGVRHRAASAAVIAGAPLPLVAAQLGHASTAVTERYYVHVNGQIGAIRDAWQRSTPKRE